MVQTPTISVPNQRMAWDLVGPLNRTVRGYRYISTVMCLGTRYPYAVALKKIDAVSVAEGLMEVIQHTGIPNELLSDQGSQFMGRVVTKTCELLNIKKLKTTAYHPQTNGALIRWHATLKGMLRKFDDSSETWDKLLKYCLLVCRAMPHAATGFSPYELVHGRSMRGSLEAMKLGWVKGDLSFATSTQCVAELRETLAKLHKVAHANEEAYKLKSKAAYDMSTKPRSFELGDMVLCHTPGLTGKLHSIWDGPYDVIAKTSGCNYKIAVPGKKSKNTTVHINRLKEWKTPVANLFRVVVAEESEETTEPIGKVKMSDPLLSIAQKAQLQAILDEFSDGVTIELDSVMEEAHVILNDGSPPVRSVPYRIAPGWRQDVKEEIQQLVREGILVPSKSALSSPIVPVRKRGTNAIRLYIDYRRLNSITRPDPFQMPMIHDLLDNVAGETRLTKVDMNKGFYQVPLDKDSQDMTAFCSPLGKFAFTRMPFGLMNAPATFQRCMQNTLSQQLEFSSIFIDDVLIYSSTWKEHLDHIRGVLEALNEAGLTAKPNKCVWGARSLEYLGHGVGNGLVSIP